MKQLIQSVSDGIIEIIDVPPPSLKPGHVLVRSSFSAISPGTERSLIHFGKANLLSKAKLRPDAVAQVLEKFQKDGLLSTVKSVRSRMSGFLPLGYSTVGRVVAVGESVTNLKVGDRVASNGPHAELVCVPQTLCAKVPDSVSDEQAALTVIGAVALHGVRNCNPMLGENFVVIGLGVVGLLACQILLANGCGVIGVEIDPIRAAIARRLGISVTASRDESRVSAFVGRRTQGVGADGVIISTSNANQSVLSLSAKISRKRGRIVLIGTADLNLARRDFYEKELAFIVSSSYGPGRYDKTYESGGVDYPLPYVRWTAGRNFDAILGLFEQGSLKTDPIVSAVFEFEDAGSAYEKILSDSQMMSSLLKYKVAPDDSPTKEPTVALFPSRGNSRRQSAGAEELRVGVIGSGNYSSTVLVPSLSRLNVELVGIASETGLTATTLGRRHGFRFSSSGASELISSGEIEAVFIATRHDSHASLAIEAINHGLSVFVEKPLALSVQDLDAIQAALEVQRINGKSVTFTVGFNRRFAPYAQRARAAFQDAQSPLFISMWVNAGKLPSSHWVLDRDVGGGRVIGEAVHFIDLMRFLVGDRITDANIRRQSSGGGDSALIDFSFEDGSIGVVGYSAEDARQIPKEDIRISSDSRTVHIDNFRRLKSFGGRGRPVLQTGPQNKGHSKLLEEFVRSCRSGDSGPIPHSEIFEVSRWAIELGRESPRR